jgi:protein-disulfide isomerase
MQVRRVAAVVVALVLLTGALSSAVAQTGAGTAKAVDSKALLAARVRGSATAPITVYEMSDFQCPYCRNFALETWPALEERYVKTGKVKWVFINFPITSIHKNAAPAAAVAMCAAKQGKFWPMHDVLFRTQKVWSSLKEPGQYFLSLADSIGASKPALRTCAASGEMDTEVENDAAGANRAGAASTPTFYIEGGLLQGAQPLPVFTQILDSIYTLRTKPKKG